MKQTFERIEKHLYRRQYQTAGGEWSTLYYARFKDWKGRPRCFPLGADLKTAREELTVYQARNIRKEDFDLDNQSAAPAPERLTISKYLQRFLKTKEGRPAYGFWKTCAGHLQRQLGSDFLDEITRTRIAEYKQLRLTEPIFRHNQPVKGSHVRLSTVNREITTLINMLNLAAEDGVLEKIPATRRLKESEDHLARERVLDPEEYKTLREASPRWLDRCIVGAYEACLSQGDLLSLQDVEIQRRRPETAMIKISGGRNKTKVRQKVPISPALAEVLDELKKERAKVRTLHGAAQVFTRDGKPISKNVLRKAFDSAKKAAGIEDFHFHDLRHCAVTRWTLAGIPDDLRKLAAGHSRRSIHERYINPPDEQMCTIFAERLRWNCNEVATQKLRTAEQSAN